MTNDTLTSPHWYRIAGLHPRLRPHVSVRMQITRGKAWYVLFNQATGRHHRVNKLAYELVGRLDGRHSVDEVWQVLLGHLGDDVPSQHDVIRILGQMTDAGLVQAEASPDVRQMLKTDELRHRREARAKLNPLSFRLGLFNPSLMLERMAGFGRVWWSVWVQWPALALMLVGLWSALTHIDEILTYGQHHFLSPTYLAFAWVAYPLMKMLHEFGHALALRRYGCEVPEVGVNFFLFVPMPYVDATASNRLVNRWQRAHISVSGIWVELLLASIGLLVWLAVEDGWVRQLAFVVLSLGGLSSLLFNGNPLMKLDGYYVLCDVLDLPNLAGRSNKLIGQVTRSAALWLARAPVRQLEPGGIAAADELERWAMALYAPASWVYRAGVSWWLVSQTADKAVWLGLVVASWSAWSLIVQPVMGWLRTLDGVSGLAGARSRVSVVIALSLGMAAGVLFWVPMPAATLAEGVVWLPDNALVRASTDGEVEAVWVQSEQAVTRGDSLITLKAADLQTDRDVLVAQIERAESQYNAAFGVDPLKMQNAQEDLRRDRQSLAQIDRDMNGHTLRAELSGRFVLSRQQDLQAHQVKRGQLLAYVLSPQTAIVRAVIPQRDIEDVRTRLQSVSVVLDEQPGQVMAARWLREVPAATDQLPMPALADRMGGRVATNPADPKELRPIEPTFVIDVLLEQPWPRAGGLARVRLNLEPQSLWTSLSQRTRQLLLRHFAEIST